MDETDYGKELKTAKAAAAPHCRELPPLSFSLSSAGGYIRKRVFICRSFLFICRVYDSDIIFRYSTRQWPSILRLQRVYQSEDIREFH